MTSKDRIENAIRHIQTATDIDPWAMEIAVDAMQRMLNVDDDLISRSAAMDEFASLVPYAIDDAVTEAYAHGLSDGYAVISSLPSAQPEINCSEFPNNSDTISRQAAMDALAEDMPQPYTPDGSHPADEGIFMAQEIYADCIQTLKELPSVQPKTAGRCINCKYHYDGDCPMRFEEIVEIDDDGYIDHDVIYHDFTRDDGYCDRWERRTDE